MRALSRCRPAQPALVGGKDVVRTGRAGWPADCVEKEDLEGHEAQPCERRVERVPRSIRGGPPHLAGLEKGLLAFEDRSRESEEAQALLKALNVDLVLLAARRQPSQHPLRA